MVNSLISRTNKARSNLYEVKAPRKAGVLKYNKKLSYGKKNSGNKIIQGDNVAVLKMLESELTGQVRCVYIDPPYNNRETYTHYEDNFSHGKWIQGIKSCVSNLKKLLREDGSIWISIDDREMHYLKVALDEILGRENFVTTIIWQQRTTRENRNVFSNDHEYILVYAKNYAEFKKTRNLLAASEEMVARYKNLDNDRRGPWQSVSANVQAGHAVASQFYEIVAPNGKRHSPPKGRCWVYSEAKMKKEIANKNVYFGKDGNGVPRLKRFLSNAKTGATPKTLWTAAEVGTSDSAKKHLMGILPDHELFDTPKPEPLIKRILEIASDPQDIILDAYLGSGTTAAVAHKLNRQYVGIELGEHAATHCVERLRKVVDEDAGGFDFYRLEY
jgi:adenine-specific DNA-methyltransferase